MNQQEIFVDRSKSEWLDKVKKDLKGKDILSLNFELWPENIVTPFYHPDDLVETSFLPRNEKVGYGVHIQLSDDPKKTNQRIIEELSGGINTIKLNLNQDSSHDYATIFDQVLMDLIHLRVLCDDDSRKRELTAYLSSNHPGLNQNNCVVHTASNTTFYEEGISEKEVLQKILKMGYALLQSGVPSQSLYAEVPFGHDFFMNVITVRAARLLWLNLVEAVSNRHNCRLIIDGVVPNSSLKSDLYDNMISLTAMAPSMMTAGVDTMFIPPSDALQEPAGTAQTRRISRNLGQILSLESHMDKVNDVASGSYFFEMETQKLAKEVWNNFVNG